MRPERFEKERNLVVDVISCEKDASLADAQLAAKTVDVSAAGMKVAMYVALPEKARLALQVDCAVRQFNLAGEVRWLRDEGETWIGILLDKESPDFESWQEAFADL